ncbi:eukaryotic translation initiation factor 3 subunit B [Thecamonas trahens ATCC 50062]|uniref:Eukaryotic translation initiation factor 3 subunit B n=1 Tax=Thecamonas trahens ATCC 50062 TaxID=461836 RepID=A0A0L0DCD9_THETB|nr:eukaryotic translation initiation factor 3 subunit B [Thecamonas trahens ATCC 50062]KNC50002.1 eukaryotic translation initiation factor 3 subunit B [Thecamonas trahens ATCC 50062]|eukprot:XP_013757171.1 eukaryotic translation initiation factor 3 subunit B [Thecamonas trahens ATCC 50062]
MVSIADPRGYQSTLRKNEWEDLEDTESDEEEPLPELPVLDESKDALLLVTNLPAEKAKKFAKLDKYVKKQLKKALNTPYNPLTDYELCVDDDGNTTGHLLLSFISDDEAAFAKAKLDGYKFDKKHVLNAYSFADLDRVAEYPDEYVPPTEDELEANLPPGMNENLRSWTTDPLGREQFVMKYEDQVQLAWAERDREPETIDVRTNWSETYLTWSPLGSYLATFHSDGEVPVGVALWGGSDMKRIRRFPHRGVKLVQFSPQENYLITWSSLPVDPQDVENTQPIMVWEVLTGKRLYTSAPKIPKEAFSWPLFQWAGDDSAFARIASDGSGIRLINMPDMTKSKIDIKGIKSFAMSPTDSLLSAWVPEVENQPARVVLVNSRTGEMIRHKNLVQVVNIDMFWQKSGDNLCVKVDRVSKSGKTFFVNLEFFRIRIKDVPVETLKLDTRVIRFSWEPTGTHFAIIHGADIDVPRPDVSFYNLQPNKVEHIKTTEGKAANELFWSPQGKHIVVAGLRELNGKLEFWSVNPPEQMAICEHLKATTVEWDPTGRYVATSISAWSSSIENGYTLWNFAGQQLRRVLKEKFYQFLWRPRPKSLLSKSQVKKIKKNLRHKSIEYDRIDTVRSSSLDSAKRAERNALLQEYRDLCTRMEADAAAMADARNALILSAAPAGYNPDDDWEEVEVETEELVKEHVVQVKE